MDCYTKADPAHVLALAQELGERSEFYNPTASSWTRSRPSC